MLGYHGIAAGGLDADPQRLMISTARFQAQVGALREAGFEFVTVSELARRAVPEPPPAGLVALTFDDGLLNLFDPLLALAGEGIPTSVYPVTDWIGGRHPHVPDPQDARTLGRDQLAELAAAGVEIGTHSATHADLAPLTPAECARELGESRRVLESMIGRPVRTAAYPFGSYTPATLEAAREAGIEVAVAMERGRGWDPLAITRARVGRGDSWIAFAIQASGRWPRFSLSAPGRVLRSARRRVSR